MTILMDKLRALMGADYDISEHLGLLRGLACDAGVNSIVEIGFRGGVSAHALASAGKPLTCYDIEPCTEAVRKLQGRAKNFTFIQGDSLKVTIPHCDLLHIDSLHTFKQLRDELLRHGWKVSRFIAMHDTETFGKSGKDGSSPGLMTAIDYFLNVHKEWQPLLHLPNNNGMTVLKRIL